MGAKRSEAKQSEEKTVIIASNCAEVDSKRGKERVDFYSAHSFSTQLSLSHAHMQTHNKMGQNAGLTHFVLLCLAQIFISLESPIQFICYHKRKMMYGTFIVCVCNNTIMFRNEWKKIASKAKVSPFSAENGKNYPARQAANEKKKDV